MSRILKSEEQTQNRLTLSPFCVHLDDFVHDGGVLVALPLVFSDLLWVSAFIGSKQIEIQHHPGLRS